MGVEVRPHKVTFCSWLACGSVWLAGRFDSWVKLARAQHTHGIVYQSLQVGDAEIAVCLGPTDDASVTPGVQWPK